MTDELDVLLHDLRRSQADSDADTRRRVRALVMAHARGAHPTTRVPSRSRRRPLLAVTGLAAALLAAVVLLTGLTDRAVHPASASAAEALERAATAAERTGGAELGPGRFFYVRDRSTYGRPPELRETWTGYDGRGSFRVRSEGRIPGRKDAEGWASQAFQPDRAGFSFGQERLSYRQLAALPTDPRALHDRLVVAAGDAGPSPEGEAFVIVADVLRTEPVPPRIRAALFRAAALIDGVRLLGPVRDPLGRRGVAIADADAGGELVFDPETGNVLDERMGGQWVRVVQAQAIVPGPRARPGGLPDAPPIPPSSAGSCSRRAMGAVVQARMAAVRCRGSVGVSRLAGYATVLAWHRDPRGRWHPTEGSNARDCFRRARRRPALRAAGRLCVALVRGRG